jgi:multimeric flavodoxin WrbA
MRTLRVGIVVYSHTGHTLTVAERLRERLSEIGHRVTLERLETVRPMSLSADRAELRTKPFVGRYDALVLGSPVRGGRMSAPMRSYLEQVPSLEGKKVACLVTGVLPAGWGRNQTLAEMEEACESKGGMVCGSGSVGWFSLGRKRQISRVVDHLSELL